VNFPHEGEEIGLTMRRYDKSLGSDDSYRQWDLRLNKALSFGADTWVFGGGYGRTLDDAEVVTSSFTLGGARELSGFRRDALSGQNYSLGRIVYYRRLTERSFLPLDFPLYLGGSIERGRIWNNDNEYDSGYINAASLMIGFDTPLGPLTFSYGINDENFKAFYLNLGQNF
ncbi:BamA/TamA family outer membrane protein, partial [Pseudomonas aeruginosa]